MVGEASTEAEAIGRVHALDPDVAILDVRLGEGNGVQACREIRSLHPRTACLMLTSFADDEALFQAIMAGASGYVLKQIRSGTSSTPCAASPPGRASSTRGDGPRPRADSPWTRRG